MNVRSLKRIRTDYGISQYKLAKLSGVARWRISCFESGYRDLSSDNQMKIITVLKRVKDRRAKNVDKFLEESDG